MEFVLAAPYAAVRRRQSRTVRPMSQPAKGRPMPRIVDAGTQLTEEELVAFEIRCGSRLPRPYRAFARENNGGSPEPDGFAFADGSPGSCVHYFFPISGGTKTDRLDYILQLFAGRVPPNYLPIARDPGGNLILIELGRGGVFFWDHEREADVGDDPTEENIIPIAASFDDFLAGLHA